MKTMTERKEIPLARYQTIRVNMEPPRATVTLSRPKVRNAFGDEMIAELTGACLAMAGERSVRVVVLTGKGAVFSAGADINWMKKVSGYTFDENVRDANTFASMLETLYRLPKPTIARVNGHCIGGGIGLAAACDVAVSVDAAQFALREVLLGIAPAVISPYVIRKIGGGAARDYFVTGRKFDARRAEAIGLINEVAAVDELDGAVDRWVRRFLRAGPAAVATTKVLIDRVAGAAIDEVRGYTAETISKLRGSNEGKEGFAAFFEKRRPSWIAEEPPGDEST